MLHCKSPVLSVLDLTLEYVKTMSFQYLVNRSGHVMETIYAFVVISILPLIVSLPGDAILFTNTSYSATSPFMYELG